MIKSGPFAPESPSRHHKARRYHRFPLDARVALVRAGHRRPLYGRTLGISEAGISALLAADLEVGESVGLEFPLPGNSQRLAVRAVVRNRSGARYGFEFVSLSEGQRSEISAFRESQNE
ncbi:MAG: PilZ domain-containing protein [Chlamydiota bacterium]